MDKTAIKNYAIYARNKLIQSTKDKAATIGIYEDKVVAPSSKGQDFEVYTSSIGTNVTLNKEEIVQRENLIKKIHNDGYKETIEEIAYTWFNRIIAIRFMEVNDYLPSRVRVLSSENAGQKESDLMQSPFSVDFSYTQKERELIISLKDQNKIDELFKVLFIKSCNELSNNLPDLFEKTIDYTELLFDIRYNDPNDVVYKLVNEMPESNFNVEEEGQVEIIGWMYQYYNTEAKIFVKNKIKNEKINKNEVITVTQVFTPDWIVRYLVENSLGRLWLESHDDSSLKSSYKYYLDEAKQDEDVQKQLDEIRKNRNLKLEEIKLIDPCMGSGHILVYAFDVFMGIYESEGWNPRDAAVSILQNNLYGLDIDKRAYQLSYFALMMKARQYNRRLLTPNNEEERVKPNVFEIKESNNIYRDLLTGTSVNQQAKDDFTSLLNQMYDAKEYGSLLEVKPIDFDNLKQELQNQEVAMFDTVIKEDIVPLIDCAKLLSQQYDVVVTNPPYLGNPTEKQYVFLCNKYKFGKYDLYSAFILKASKFMKTYSYAALVTGDSWLTLPSFGGIRDYLVENETFINLIKLEYNAFDYGMNTVMFAYSKNRINNYLSKFSSVKNEYQIQNANELIIFIKDANEFKQIKDTPFIFKLSKKVIESFQHNNLGNYGVTKSGIVTGNNDLFMKLWYEVDNRDICFNARSMKEVTKWVPSHKGGSNFKYYGNTEYVMKLNDIWNDDFYTSNMRRGNPDFYFLEGFTWSTVSKKVAFRYSPIGYVYETKGSMFFVKNRKYIYYLLGFLNSKIVASLLEELCPGVDFNRSSLLKIPVIESNINCIQIDNIVNNNLKLSIVDWDSFEISWDFETHPFIRLQKGLWDATSVGCTMSHYYGKPVEVSSPLELCYLLWQGECNERFNTLKANEEELNRIFIDIYDLQDELTPDVEDKDVTVRKADELRDVKSFISYAVGCMFGRYSLDKDGLAYAGGDFNMDDYYTFKPDVDNIIPISEVGYFEDDITSRFIKFISKVFGEDSLQDNLAYIARVLGGKGSAEEVIRNYFISDFYKDHVKMYQKRPIYWLFDSGKNNGFKALIYMHRYNPDTVSNVRTEYLHKFQNTYELLIRDEEYVMEHSDSKAEVTKAMKHKENLEKKLAETRIYDQALAHIANKRIDIDLDDGVKVNYEKFQNVEVINEGSKAIKVNLLSKIK